MIDWYKKVVFENYANFKGRARRSEYWYYTLATIIISIILSIIDEVLGLKFGSNQGILNTIYSFAVFLPGLAVAVRRFHDVGKSGWMLVIMYVGIIALAVVSVVSGFAIGMAGDNFGAAVIIPILLIFGLVIWLLVILCTDGDEGPNEYGADPKSFGEEINEIGTAE